MDQATQLWAWWLSLLSAFTTVFTRPGWVRFAQWVTGMVLCWEEHTLTQILTALGLESRWRVLEHFAEYGAWDREAVERHTLQLLEQERPARWGRYHPVAVDDTKLHRTSKRVWGTCTFHESSARSPNRAETVRAHNWVVMGDLRPGHPWTYLSHAGRLYCRQSQLPPGETFCTKTALAVELLRQADARLYHPVGMRPQAKGRPPKWGPRITAPQHHLYWPVSWQRSRAWVYGRRRAFQYKQLRCRWAVSGSQIPVDVLVVQMAGDEEPWFLVTSALDLTAAQVVEVWAARFRQEDGFRDHKQRLGMEECRAWTKEPILRTFQVQLVTLTLLRLLQGRVDQAWGSGSW